MSGKRTAALVGNPNAGKSALFNALTGARQKIANYPGVTVERKAGRLVLPSGEPVELVDLPGSYGFDAASPDEEVTRKVVFGEFAGRAAARSAGGGDRRLQHRAAPGVRAGSDRARAARRWSRST